MAENAVKSVTLPAVLDLDALDGVRDKLIEATDLGSVQVDGSGVERVATNSLLMLLSAAESARAHGHEFELVDASLSMASAIERLGLAPSFRAAVKHKA